MKMKFERKITTEENSMSSQRFYENKYFSLFLDAFKFTNLSKNQTRFLLKSMWSFGTVAAFIIEGTREEPTLQQALTNSSPNTVSPAQNNPQGLLCFTPYATNQWNIEDEPAVVTLINKRGATFIPTTPQVVNKDVVIGWGHTSHASVRSLAMYYISKIVEVEKTISVNLFAHKLPRLVICSPEDRDRVEDLMDKIEAGEKKLFLEAEDWQAIKNVLDSGAGGYIIDKLYLYKQNLENELLTFLGINNVAINKKERLITDEAESNDQLINDSNDCFFNSLVNFCEEIKDVLGYDIEVISQTKEDEEEQEQEQQDEEDNEDEE